FSTGRHEIGSPEWRPFRGPLQGSSLRYVKLVCDSFFSYLVEARYLSANPFSLARKRTRAVVTDEPIAPPTARRHQLSDEALALAQEWIGALPDTTPSQKCRKLRYRATLSLFLFTGGRLSEIASANTQNLVQSKGRWTLWVIGKGGKKAGLPLPPTLMRDLSDYRLANGLPTLPQSGERLPILTKLLRPEEGITDNMVYREVKAILKGAGEIAHERGRDDLEHLLKHSSTHWLRHTTIGATVEATQDLQLAQQLGRHSSVNTTSIYSSLADEQFHDKVSETLEGVFGSL
ncbi:MAG: tyrosine-type recombinase/integrase, partial [Azoarcus sp.]